MEKKPQFFTRKGKLPTDAELAEMNNKAMKSSNSSKQPSKKEDSQMTETDKGKKEKPRKRITSEQVARMIKEWNDKTTSEWAIEFGVSSQTISKMAEIVNKADASLCKKKKAIKIKREDIAKEAIALFKKKEAKK